MFSLNVLIVGLDTFESLSTGGALVAALFQVHSLYVQFALVAFFELFVAVRTAEPLVFVHSSIVSRQVFSRFESRLTSDARIRRLLHVNHSDMKQDVTLAGKGFVAKFAVEASRLGHQHAVRFLHVLLEFAISRSLEAATLAIG